ncbi:hypothetical protein GCM10009744_55290 [Kribbella alba]|uniref:Uncharacterized protein n=1 Tax=Kribbella alba TaxID=190197 RepID=A0ABN2FPD4_9ACTN
MSIGEAFFTDGSLVVTDAHRGRDNRRARYPDVLDPSCLLALSCGPQAVRSRSLDRATRPKPRRPDARALPADRVRLPSGLSPSVPEFHQVNRPPNYNDRVADYHRRLGITPTPEHASGFTRGSSVPLPATLTRTWVTS